MFFGTNIIPLRIKEARQARALSMQELSDKINVSKQSISKYEMGIMSPSPEVLCSMAIQLNFPIEYFSTPIESQSAVENKMFFRANKNIPNKIKDSCKHPMDWIYNIYTLFANYVEFPKINLPDSDIEYINLSDDDIENHALLLRQHWGLGLGPINDLIGLLENNGIIIGQFSPNEKKHHNISGFSLWKNNVPFIIYLPDRNTAVRNRFSIAHELGHLIFHRNISKEQNISKEDLEFIDAQADRFAAAFLMPSAAVQTMIYNTSVKSIIPIKENWGIALSTIIRRFSDLEILNLNQLGYLKKQMTTNNYWHNEPLDDILLLDPPSLLNDSLNMLIDNNIMTLSNFLHQIPIPEHEIISLCSLPKNYFSNLSNKTNRVISLLTSNI